MSSGQSLDDPERVADLEETGLLKLKNEESFQKFTRIAAALVDVPVSLVSLVSTDHQHFVACEGLTGDVAEKARTPLSHSFCQYVVCEGRSLIVEDARKDPRLCDNGAIEDLNVIAYLGVPIRSGRFNVLGSFCVIDTKPRKWSDEEINEIADLAHVVGHEIDLRRKTRELEQTNQQLKEAEARNDELIQMMLHDLRNPLFGITGGLSMLADSSALTDTDREAISICEDSCRQMNYLLGEILETNKMRLTHLNVEKKSLNAVEFLTPIIEREEMTAKASSITFTADVSDKLNTIQADEGILRRTMQNILVNAFKYTPKGGKVSLSAYSENGHVVFAVSDTGPGISEKERKSIFEKYSVGDSGKKSKNEIIGLGLTFCKAAVEQHGGQISVESELGKGSTFYISLPQQ
ncbi:GAF domain-containing sensor histidine kinase [Cerasicoccus fimbriatus]|uniref:GAF domain-containing sensor histidine kinase n=1 Tax=Cerasicoccus fimbriatus TaxID=3014554 RepID=UPI0022B505A7|nr:GAF domain-containing sensor histidine kinase [Cerasicoccus sp. TK19100]